MTRHRSCCLAALFLSLATVRTATAALRVGTARVDITPQTLPVLVSGGFLSRSANSVKTPLHARALVLDDGTTRAAIVVVDTCMMPRTFLDEAKQQAAARTGIRPEKILIAATHTHSAPSVAGGLGTDREPTYGPFLRRRLVASIEAAEAALQPALVGWATADAGEYTALRRWIRRPDRMQSDPFGDATVRANMHAARNWDDVTGPSGPEDPELSLVSFQRPDGHPLAVLANFSMHYYSDKPISADYFGLFCQGLASRLAPRAREGGPPFVGLFCHGCSGDVWLRDYAKPAGERDEEWTIESYTDCLLATAMSAYETIEHVDDASLAMAEKRLRLNYRVPDPQRLAWARGITSAMGDRPPKDKTEVYAREQVILHERQATDVVIQALRIGDICIATTPTETYALTGLKLKRQSPFPRTMVLDLANGADGYIPPPEQHVLGGYNTWPARSAGLEVQAEPRIAEAALRLLETVTGQPRRRYVQSRGPAVEAILRAAPAAYWRMDEFGGSVAHDASEHGLAARYEPGAAFFLPGPRPERFCTSGEENRCVHFAGGRLHARIPGLTDHYSVSLWFWNGMPADARGVSGWLLARDRNGDPSPHGDQLGIGGTNSAPGMLMFQHGGGAPASAPVVGRTRLARWTWNHVLFTRDGKTVRVYLNGQAEPEIVTTVNADFPSACDHVYVGGRADGQATWEGRLDEVAVFTRALTPRDLE